MNKFIILLFLVCCGPGELEVENKIQDDAGIIDSSVTPDSADPVDVNELSECDKFRIDFIVQLFDRTIKCNEMCQCDICVKIIQDICVQDCLTHWTNAYYKNNTCN